MEKITFDTMPEALSEILKRIGNLETMVGNMNNHNCVPVVEEVRFNITELCDYLPTKPKKQTRCFIKCSISASLNHIKFSFIKRISIYTI